MTCAKVVFFKIIKRKQTKSMPGGSSAALIGPSEIVKVLRYLKVKLLIPYLKKQKKIYICIYIYVHTYTYIHVYTHISIYMYTYIYMVPIYYI